MCVCAQYVTLTTVGVAEVGGCLCVAVQCECRVVSVWHTCPDLVRFVGVMCLCVCGGLGDPSSCCKPTGERASLRQLEALSMAPGMTDVGSGASAWCGPGVLSSTSLPLWHWRGEG